MGKALTGLGEAATFQDGTCSTEGLVGRRTMSGDKGSSRDHGKGSKRAGKVPGS